MKVVMRFWVWIRCHKHTSPCVPHSVQILSLSRMHTAPSELSARQTTTEGGGKRRNSSGFRPLLLTSIPWHGCKAAKNPEWNIKIQTDRDVQQSGGGKASLWSEMLWSQKVGQNPTDFSLSSPIWPQRHAESQDYMNKVKKHQLCGWRTRKRSPGKQKYFEDPGKSLEGRIEFGEMTSYRAFVNSTLTPEPHV